MKNIMCGIGHMCVTVPDIEEVTLFFKYPAQKSRIITKNQKLRLYKGEGTEKNRT